MSDYIIHKLFSLNTGNSVQMGQQVQFTTAVQLNRLIFPLTLKKYVHNWPIMACSSTFYFAAEGAVPYMF